MNKQKIIELMMIHTFFGEVLLEIERKLMTDKDLSQQKTLVADYQIQVSNYFNVTRELEAELKLNLEYASENNLPPNLGYKRILKQIGKLKEVSIF